MSETDDSFLPDIASLVGVGDIEIPTQYQVQEDENKLTLSGLINSVVDPDSQVATYKIDPKTVAGQNQQLEIILQHQVNDIQSIMHGFGNPDQINLMSPQIPQMSTNGGGGGGAPWVEILEQPKSNSLRFRYECEGKGAGALQGKHSTQENKTFPKIKIHGFKGFATVVVSCVTHNHDVPKSHPHNLVSPASVQHGCNFGICTQVIDRDTMTAEFPHLGIQCVKRRDIKRNLEQRKEKKVDPYRTGWKHMENTQSIDLNAVKLCFHVWYESDVKGKCTRPMAPVCSDIIYDAKAKKELQICDISDTTCSVRGDKKIIILCEKVSRDDIKIRFFDDKNWEGYGIFAPSDVHKQYAISFHPPKYKLSVLKEKVKVQVELCKVNGETSEPQDFYYVPDARTISDQRHQGYSEDKFKQEIKIEDTSHLRSNHQQQQQQQVFVSRQGMGKSPYTHIQMGQQGNFVLSEKLTSDISLTNIQPFNPSIESPQIANLLNLDLPGMPPSLVNGMPPSLVNGMAIQRDGSMAMLPDMSQVIPNMSPQYSAYSPEHNINVTMPNDISFQDMDNPGRILYESTDSMNQVLGGYYSTNQMTETVKNLSENLSNTMNIQDEQQHQQQQYQQQQQHHQQQQQQQQQGGGKRSQKDANLESGSMVLPYQQAKTDEAGVKPNLSRQQSSLNTPTVSEQLTSNSFNMSQNNIAGDQINSF